MILTVKCNRDVEVVHIQQTFSKSLQTLVAVAANVGSTPAASSTIFIIITIYYAD